MMLIIDEKAGIADSLQRSSAITRGNVLMLFVLYLLGGAINVGGLLACCVGLFFTQPYVLLLWVVTYLALTGQPTADPLAKGPPIVELEPL
jgi:hypothetical protein